MIDIIIIIIQTIMTKNISFRYSCLKDSVIAVIEPDNRAEYARESHTSFANNGR